MAIFIYALIKGEKSEGSDILSIHADRDDAIKKIPNNWEPDLDGYYWDLNGIDYYYVETHDLHVKDIAAFKAALDEEVARRSEKHNQIVKIQELLGVDLKKATKIWNIIHKGGEE